MSEVNGVAEPTSAALVGSLTAFPLLDVLHLLARLGSSGEFQVLGPDLDRRFWVDAGDLLDGSGDTPGARLFELACLEGGWFSFTASTGVPTDAARSALAPLIDDAASRLAEWRALVRRLPFEAVVRMSQSTPSDEVQVRAEQWRVLSFVGPGRTVLEVLSSSSLPAVDTLRTLGQLLDGQLLSVELPADHVDEGRVPVADTPPPPPPVEAAPAPEAVPARRPVGTRHPADERPGRAEPVAGHAQTGIMPPPITGDPWSTPEQMTSGHRNPGG
jgi:hypothetical protein